MRKKAINFGLATLVSVSMLGCGEVSKDELKSTEAPLREITEQIEWNGITLESITPVCSYEILGNDLYVFPYNENDSHIIVKEVLISDNDFWNTVLKSYRKKNTKRTKHYSLVTNKNGETFGYLKKDKNKAYLAVTSNLPSSYVAFVLEYLCSLDT